MDYQYRHLRFRLVAIRDSLYQQEQEFQINNPRAAVTPNITPGIGLNWVPVKV